MKSFWDGTCSKEHVPSTFVLNTNLGLFTKETKLDDLGCAVCNDNPNDKKIYFPLHSESMYFKDM